MKVKTLITELKDRLLTSIDMANDAGSRVKMYQQLLDKEQNFYTSMLCDAERIRGILDYLEAHMDLGDEL